MTHERFKDLLKTQGGSNYEDTCFHLKLAMVKKIVNCKASEEQRYTMLQAYITNNSTNNDIISAINEINRRNRWGD